MSLYVGIHLEPGDLMEVEFETPYCARVKGIVRSRVGYCFGLEFLTPLVAAAKSAEFQQSSPYSLPAQTADSCRVQQQELETSRSQGEIDVSKQPSAAPPFAHGGKATRDELTLDGVLHDIAARAMQVTGATGVAIGLGREGVMICRAPAGLALPDVGVRINTESGLTAAAIRSQMAQWCCDTESDSRVDVEVCRQLGVRSMIVMPVRARDTVVGVFAIFSANLDAFTLSDLKKAKELAQGTTEAIETSLGNAAPRTTVISSSYS